MLPAILELCLTEFRAASAEPLGKEPEVRDDLEWPNRAPCWAARRASDSVTAALLSSDSASRSDSKRAVDHLDLEVRRGCMFGLVGPNGAGKTTTLSMATGLLRPDAGTARVLDHDVWADPAGAKALDGCAARRIAAVRPAQWLGVAALCRTSAADCLRLRSPAALRSCSMRSHLPTIGTPSLWSTRPA